MMDFQKRLDVEGFPARFAFNRMATPGALRFHVAVTDPAGTPCLFDMQQVAGRWKIINAPQVPEWILTREEDLERLIREEERY